MSLALSKRLAKLEGNRDALTWGPFLDSLSDAELALLESLLVRLIDNFGEEPRDLTEAESKLLTKCEVYYRNSGKVIA